MSARLCNVWKKQTVVDYPRTKSRNQVSKGEGISGPAGSKFGTDHMVKSCDLFYSDLTFLVNKYSILVTNQSLGARKPLIRISSIQTHRIILVGKYL